MLFQYLLSLLVFTLILFVIEHINSIQSFCVQAYFHIPAESILIIYHRF